MNTKPIVKIISVLLVGLLLSSCGPGQLFGPTLTPTLTPTPIPPTLTPTPEPIGEVQISQGTVILISIDRVTAWPTNCDSNASFGQPNACIAVASPGYEMLMINFVLKDSPEETKIPSLDANIYVVDKDGQQFELGSTATSGSLRFVVFFVPVGVKDLTLYWEDNPPIPLP